MTKKSIEDLFKDSFEDFEEEVSPTVWENIKTGLKGAGLGLLGKTLINKIGTNTLIAVVSSAVTVIATVSVMNWTGNAVKKSGDESKAKAVVNEKQNPPATIENKTISQPVAEAKKEETDLPIAKENMVKSEDKSANGEQDMQETKILVKPFHKDKKEIQKVIKSFSEIQIASIFASPVGGTVPLIVNLSNSGNGKTNKWKYSDGKKDDNIPNPVHVFETPGTFTITLTSTDENGKTSVDTKEIEVTGNSSMMATPRELTPNGDGINDVFSFNGKNLVKMSGQIFDSKGNIIFECDKVGAKWDGKTRNGEDAKEGTYFYLESADGKDGKHYEQHGSIHLTR